jgi:putative transposase
MCRLLNVSESGYRIWKNRDPSTRELEEKRITKLIREAFEKSRNTYGSPRIHAILKSQGESVSRSRVERIMRKNGVRSKMKRKFRATTDSNHKLPVAENILNREFEQKSPDSAWVCDITYIWTDEGWLYLAVVMDLFSRRIVGWAMEKTMEKELVLKALTMALRCRNPSREASLLVHSDRGSQYASSDYQQLLKLYSLTCSMSRRGNCWDNSSMESFFGTLKTEHVFFERFKTREQARQSIFEWIECFYNRERVHSALGFLAPVKYEELTKVA